MPKYRYVGDHADFVNKGEEAAVPVAPGDFVELTAKEADDPHNKELNLLPVEAKGGK